MAPGYPIPTGVSASDTLRLGRRISRPPASAPAVGESFVTRTARRDCRSKKLLTSAAGANRGLSHNMYITQTVDTIRTEGQCARPAVRSPRRKGQPVHWSQHNIGKIGLTGSGSTASTL